MTLQLIAHCIKYLNESACKDCEMGYFEDDGKCTKCMYFCANCTNSTECANCAYGTNATSSGCAICTKFCAKCSNSSDCETCLPGYNLTNSTTCSVCQVGGCSVCPNETACDTCLPGYAKNGLICDVCKVENCEECTANVDTCEECKAGFLMDNNSCVPCPDNYCLECRNDTTNCLKCSENFLLYDGYCVCRDGYFRYLGACIPCSKDCEKCTSLDNCIRCAANFTYEGNYCFCKDNTYNDAGTCIPCDDANCTNCIMAKDYCYECKNNRFPIAGKCECVAEHCEECDTPTSCSKCRYPFVLSGEYKRCKCLSNQYVSGDSCLPCNIVGCDECSLYESQVRCFKCSNNYESKDGSSCQSICASELDTQGKCTTCNAGYTANGQGVCHKCSDILFSGCLLCDSPNVCTIGCNKVCESCTGASEKQCVSCINGKVMDAGMCLDCSAKFSSCKCGGQQLSNCISCDNSGLSCSACQKYYTLKGGKCEYTGDNTMKILAIVFGVLMGVFLIVAVAIFLAMRSGSMGYSSRPNSARTRQELAPRSDYLRNVYSLSAMQ